MNFHDPIIPPRHEAKLRYLDHEFEVLREGAFVRCAITGEPVPLDSLRYWSIEKQVAFKSAAEAFTDYLDAKSDA